MNQEEAQEVREDLGEENTQKGRSSQRTMDRRGFLAAAGSATATAVGAGCTELGGGGQDSTATPEDEDTPEATESPSPTEKPTPTPQTGLEDLIELNKNSSLKQNYEEVQENLENHKQYLDTAEKLTADILEESKDRIGTDLSNVSQDEIYSTVFETTFDWFQGETDNWDSFEHATMAAAEALNHLNTTHENPDLNINGPNLQVTQIKDEKQTETTDEESQQIELHPTIEGSTSGNIPNVLVEKEDSVGVYRAGLNEWNSDIAETELLDGIPFWVLSENAITGMLEEFGYSEEGYSEFARNGVRRAVSELGGVEKYDAAGFTKEWSEKVSEEVKNGSTETLEKTYTHLSNNEYDAPCLDIEDGEVYAEDGMDHIQEAFKDW